MTGEQLIAFDGCPLVGAIKAQETLTDFIRQVEYPFPRNPQIRSDLVSWFVDKGINFTVVM
ncbi:hypothetical protein G3A42_27580 [Paraburkholderia aspalathi]|nr:hypothetical protein [Paraburkholderia aspalathi]